MSNNELYTVHALQPSFHYHDNKILACNIINNTNIGSCYSYLSIIVLLRRAGKRLIPSISLSLGIGILAKLRAVANQSIKLPN